MFRETNSTWGIAISQSEVSRFFFTIFFQPKKKSGGIFWGMENIGNHFVFSQSVIHSFPCNAGTVFISTFAIWRQHCSLQISKTYEIDVVLIDCTSLWMMIFIMEKTPSVAVLATHNLELAKVAMHYTNHVIVFTSPSPTLKTLNHDWIPSSAFGVMKRLGCIPHSLTVELVASSPSSCMNVGSDHRSVQACCKIEHRKKEKTQTKENKTWLETIRSWNISYFIKRTRVLKKNVLQSVQILQRDRLEGASGLHTCEQFLLQDLVRAKCSRRIKLSKQIRILFENEQVIKTRH